MTVRQGDKARVGVLFGGRSGEHEISIRSAHFVAAEIDRSRFEVILVGIDRDGGWHLHSEETFRATDRDAAGVGTLPVLAAPGSRACRLIDPQSPGNVLASLDVVFPVLHGPYGEDGTIQGFLEFLDVPYVGAGVLGSAVGMDKDVQKRLLVNADLPVVPYVVISRDTWANQRTRALETASSLGDPLFVKPANLGSSLGISKTRTPMELEAAIELAFGLDSKVVIEKGIDAREIECAVLGNDAPDASIPGEIVPGADFYSYDAKYASESPARLLIPAPIPDDTVRSVQRMAVRVFQVLECAGMARVDFFLEREGGRLYVNELNTIPGFTSISMYPKLWEASGVTARELTSTLIQLAKERRAARPSSS